MMAITFTLNGKWRHIAGKEWSYSGGTSYITCVRKNITFEEVKAKIYNRARIDPLGYELNIKLLYTTGGIHQTDPVEICDDDSWFGYLCEKKENKPMKLCVDAKQAVTTEPPRQKNEVMIDLNEARIDLHDDNLVQCAQPEILSPRVSEMYHIDKEREQSDYMVGNGLFDTSNLSDDTINEVPTTSFTELLVGRSSQPFNDAGTTPTLLAVNSSSRLRGGDQIVTTRHTVPPTANGVVPTIPVQQTFGAHHLEARHTYGSSSIHGGSDLGDFGDGLAEFEIPLCPRSGTITTEDENGLYVGKLFKNKDALSDTLKLHAMKNRYEFGIKRSDTKTLHLICLRSNCEWMMKGKKANGKDKDAEWFKITEYEEKHTCGLENITNEHAQAKPSVIGRLVRDDVVKLKGKFKAKNVQVEVDKLFGISLNYSQAYRSIEESVRMIGGTLEQSYSKLLAYFHMIEEANPHTLTDLYQDEIGRFKYCFMSLGPSIVGFKFCRPIICVDGTHLKNKYGGTLLVAVGVDAGDHLFPLAVGVADGESIESWTYFFNHLKKAIGEREDIQDLAFVSDRNQAIKTSLENVFPDAYHGICYHHLEMNVKDKFTLERYCPVTLKQAAYTCSRREFDILFEQIKQKNKDVHDYLLKAGLKLWARSHFPGTRYAIMTSNYAESFNALLVEARKMSITNMLEYCRKTLQRWYHERRELAYECRSVLAPEVEKLLKHTVESRINFTLHPIDGVEFQVSDLDSSCRVNLHEQKCYCGEWQALRLPCAHAALAIAKRSLNIYSFCDHYYKAECFKRIYEGRVFPVPHEKHWKIPDSIREKCVLPPIERDNVSGDRIRRGKKRGRRATKRIRSNGERTSAQRIRRNLVVGKRTRKCSCCGVAGHRKDKCPTPLSLG